MPKTIPFGCERIFSNANNNNMWVCVRCIRRKKVKIHAHNIDMAAEAHNNAKDYMQCCWACEWFISSVRFRPNLIENSNISRIIQNKPNIVHCARSSLEIAFNTAHSLEMLNPMPIVNGLTLTIGLKPSFEWSGVCVLARASLTLSISM